MKTHTSGKDTDKDAMYKIVVSLVLLIGHVSK